MQPSPRPNASPRDRFAARTRTSLSSPRFALIGAIALLICTVAGLLFATGGSSPSGGLASNTPTATVQATSGTDQLTPSPSVTTSPQAGTATPSATATTPRPKPTNTPRPTVKPSPTATPIPLKITITCATISIANGGDVCIHTEPGVSIQLNAVYCSGGDASYDYVNEVADDQGNYEWTWSLDTTCTTTPNATVYVLAWIGSQIVSATEDVPLT